MLMTTKPGGVRPPWGLAWRLAAGQIVSWGILYYSFTVMVGPIHEHTGWSRSFLNVGLSLGLLTWGMGMYPVGFWIQRRGARGLMTAASSLGALALGLMAFASTPSVYVLAWLLLGASLAGSLYEPAFAVVTAAFGENYRRGITLITLVGGLASTVFIPLGQFAVTHLGWQKALLALAIFEAAVCVPLYWFGLPAAVSAKPVTAEPGAAEESSFAVGWRNLRADAADRRFIGLAVWFAAHSAAFTGLIFQLVPMLQAWGVAPAAIAWAMAFMGPMQVLGRLFLSLRGEHFSSLRVGLAAMACLFLAAGGLLLLPHETVWLCVFMGLFGLGNGIITIVRGTSVAEVFGRSRYAEINGALATPGILARAAAPLGLAAIWTASGQPGAIVVTVLILLLVGAVAILTIPHPAA